jgi:hypothetical protein
LKLKREYLNKSDTHLSQSSPPSPDPSNNASASFLKYKEEEQGARLRLGCVSVGVSFLVSGED